MPSKQGDPEAVSHQGQWRENLPSRRKRTHKGWKEVGGPGIRREGQQPGQLRSGSHGPTSLFLCPSLRCTAASPPPPLARWTSSVPTAGLQPKDHPALMLWTHTPRQVVLLAWFYPDIQIQGPQSCCALELFSTSEFSSSNGFCVIIPKALPW